jgi:hypothetical protein
VECILISNLLVSASLWERIAGLERTGNVTWAKEAKNSSIKAFLDSEGRITQIPVPVRTKLPVLAYLAEKFEYGKTYKEKEINGIISQWHTFQDFFILRRLLVDYHFLARTPDGDRYWVVEQERKGDANGQEKGIETPI